LWARADWDRVALSGQFEAIQQAEVKSSGRNGHQRTS
jgi:hypothetical protein